MAHAGQQLTNAMTGERLVFITVPEDRSRAFVFEDHWTRPGHRVAAHIHPEMDERWEIVEGDVTFRIGGTERTAYPGDVIEASAGTPHMAWMAADAPVVMRVTIEPALCWPEFTEELFDLAARGRADDAGIPHENELLDLLERYQREIAPPEPVA